DGIRDFHVTGVQTCALPILTRRLTPGRSAPFRPPPRLRCLPYGGQRVALTALPPPFAPKQKTGAWAPVFDSQRCGIRTYVQRRSGSAPPWPGDARNPAAAAGTRW